MATVSPISSRAAASAPAPLATNLHGAADYLAVSVSSVRRQIASGKLPAARLGHRLVIRYADLDALVASSIEGGPNDAA